MPYRAGSSDVMRDVVAGHIDLTIDQAICALPYIRQGQVRAYAVADSKRLASAPDIPTVDEAGAPGVYVIAWYGMWMPKGTPKEVIAKFTAAALEALADPAVRERLAGLGQDIPPPETQTAEALGRFYKAEIEKWWPIIKGGRHQGRVGASMTVDLIIRNARLSDRAGEPLRYRHRERAHRGNRACARRRRAGP